MLHRENPKTHQLSLFLMISQHRLPDWLCKTFLVLCQCAPSQGIVPKLHTHLSSVRSEEKHHDVSTYLDMPTC
jgi:hypothetical protein